MTLTPSNPVVLHEFQACGHVCAQVPAGYKEVTVAEIKEARESENLEV